MERALSKFGVLEIARTGKISLKRGSALLQMGGWGDSATRRAHQARLTHCDALHAEHWHNLFLPHKGAHGQVRAQRQAGLPLEMEAVRRKALEQNIPFPSAPLSCQLPFNMVTNDFMQFPRAPLFFSLCIIFYRKYKSLALQLFLPFLKQPASGGLSHGTPAGHNPALAWFVIPNRVIS